MRSRISAWFLLFSPVVLPAQADTGKLPPDTPDGPPYVNATAWAIVDARSGAFVAGAAADQRLPMASTTKVMTALLALKVVAGKSDRLDEVVEVSHFAGSTGGSTARIRPGDRITVRHLLYGLLLPSGNDAANAIAQHFGRHFAAPEDPKSIPWNTRSAARDQPWMNFVAEMNREAKRLGLTNTRFVNPHGLDAEFHYSTPRDLLVLTRAAMAHGLFRRITATREYRAPVVTQAGTRRTELWANTNDLLKIQGYEGIKTGTTSRAGACLIALGSRGEDRLLVCVLNSNEREGRYVDTRNLFRWAFNQRLAGGK